MTFKISAATRPVADFTFLLAGQSVCNNLQHTDGIWWVTNNVITKAVSPTLPGKQIDPFNICVGNSYEDRHNAQYSVPASGHYWFDPLVTTTGSGATNGSTASSSAVLHFASTPAGVQVGALVTNLTVPGSITSPTYVLSFDATSVTMSQNAHSTVASGNTISFSNHGPLLDTGLALIGVLTYKPTHVIWDGGQSDAIYASTVGLGADPNIAARYKVALTAIFAALRNACNPGDPTSVPIYLVPVARTDTPVGAFPGMQIIRDAQLEIIRDGTNIFNGGTMWHLGMDSQFHVEYGEMGKPGNGYGAILGDVIALNSFAATDILLGPSVSSVTMGSPTRVDVAIDVEAGDTLVQPGEPWGLRVEDSAAPGVAVEITGYSWVGNTLRLSIAHGLTGDPLFYVAYDYGQGFISQSSTTAVSNYDNDNTLIMGGVSGKPLRYYLNA